jgi:hypothetical protein
MLAVDEVLVRGGGLAPRPVAGVDPALQLDLLGLVLALAGVVLVVVRGLVVRQDEGEVGVDLGRDSGGPRRDDDRGTSRGRRRRRGDEQHEQPEDEQRHPPAQARRGAGGLPPMPLDRSSTHDPEKVALVYDD